MNAVTEIMDTVLSRLKDIIGTDTVIGDPVEIAGRTIIPVIKVSIGFGAGGGEGTGEKEKGSGTGGGGGGGASVIPVAFLVVDKEDVRLLPMKTGSFDNLLDAVPTMMEKFTKSGKSETNGKNKEKKKFRNILKVKKEVEDNSDKENSEEEDD